MEKYKNWAIDTAKRTLKTMAETACGLITVGAVMSDINWILVGSTSLVAGIYTVLINISNLPE